MDINELETYRLSDAIKFHDRLNPQLWGRDEHLLPEVREKLLEIAADFQEFLGIDVDVEDITISGSNAAYTYTPHSDIDLHLVVDLPRADSDDVYRELFDAKKYQYNDRNDFKIAGYDVELYVQDPNRPHHSQGIYSVKNDQWIDVPKRRKPAVDDVSVRSKYEDLGARIESAIESGDLAEMDAMAAKLKDLRAAGLAQQGEFGAENLAFKILRNNGTLEKLSTARKAARDARMSLDERRKKKKRGRKKYAYGGYWFPGYHYYGDTAAAADGGGDGGGESVRESAGEDQQSIIERFARSCSDFLGMEQCPKIKLRRDPQWSRVNRTFGRYSPDSRSIELAVAGRHIVDVLRTLAHEMTHARQDEVVGLPRDAGETGSTYEDQANALAGQIMRHWAESEPGMFAGVDLDEGWKSKAAAAAVAAGIATGAGMMHHRIDQDVQRISIIANQIRDQDPRVANALDQSVQIMRMKNGYTQGLERAERIMQQYRERGGKIDEDWRRAAGAATAAACIAGTPGCATTDAVKTVQTIGRAAQNIPTRAGAEEELRQRFKDYLRQQRGEVVPEDYDPDHPPGPESKPTMPQGTVRVDVSDMYDWYKLGQHISDLEGLGRHDFGKGPPSTILAFGDEDLEHEYIKNLQRTGLDVTDVDPAEHEPVKGIKTDPTYNVAEVITPIGPSQRPLPATKSDIKQKIKPPVEPTRTRTEYPGDRTRPDEEPRLVDIVVKEASGYIPTEREKNDPRYSMALTVDIKPGQTGREANKLGLKTDSQGRPQLLMRKLENLLESVKTGTTMTPTVQTLYREMWAEVEDLIAARQNASTNPHHIQSLEARIQEIQQELAGEGYRFDYTTGRLQPLNEEATAGSVIDLRGNYPGYSRLEARVDSVENNRATLTITAAEGSGRFKTGDRFRIATNYIRRAPAVIQEDEDLFEVKMSPTELKKWADSEEAQGIRAGFEAELIFRDTGREEEQESEPDYDQDERARDIDQVVDFFQGGENGITARTARQLRNELYDQFHEWVSNTFYDDVWNERKYSEWVDDNIWPDEQDEWRERAQAELGLTDESELTPEQTERIEQTAQQMFREEAEEQWENQGPWYSQAEESLLDEFRDENDEGEWLDSNYRYMSDIESEFNLDWPYWTSGGDREGGSRDPEDIADSLGRSLGVRVVSSSDYHSTRRRPDLWIIEPDGSLSPDDYEDTGLEVVSPPMPLPEALQKLREIMDWANDSNEGNAYTNSSTGLHMGVSIPHKGGDVDYVKLILFMGDQYVLEQFGRAANSYAASALEKLRQVQTARRRGVQEQEQTRGQEKTAAAMDLMRKNLIELAAKYVQDSVGQSKYTSAHIKDGYIEFRSPGGDYLSMDSRDEDALQNTMLRFARAMYLAGRPDLERKEYSKKLYKLLSGFRGAEISKPTQDTRYKTRIEFEDQQDAMELFARYASGQITPDELKKQWAQQVLAREMPKPAGEFEYEVVKDVSRHPDEPVRREVVDVIRANGENEADRMVRDRYENEPDYYKYSARRRRYQYEIINRDTGEVMGTIEDINLDRAIDRAWDQYGPGGENIPFDVRQRAEDEKPKKPLSRRAEIAKRLADKPTLWTVKAMDREIFVMAPNVEQAKRTAQQQDPFFDRNRSYIDVRPSTRAEQAEYRVQQADNEKDLEQIQRRVAPGRGRYLVKWTEFRDGQEVPDSIRQEGDSPEDAVARIRRVLELQGRTPANMRAELVDIRVPPSDRDDTASQREYHIYHRGTGMPAVAFRAADDEAALERLDQYRQQHPAIDVGVRRGSGPESSAVSLPSSGEWTGQWQIRDNTGRVLHTFGGIGNNQADANRFALRWLIQQGYGHGTEIEVTPEMQ